MKSSGGTIAGTPRRHRKKLVFGAAVLGVVIVAAGVIYAIKTGWLFASQCNGREGNSLYVQSAQAIKNKDTKQLDSLVATVKDQRDYERDVNCLIPVYYSAEFSKDYYNADKSLSTMTKIQGGHTKVVSAYESIKISSVNDLGEINYNARTKRTDTDNVIYF